MNTPKIGINLIVDLSLKFLMMYQSPEMRFFQSHEPKYFLGKNENPLENLNNDVKKAEYFLLSEITKINAGSRQGIKNLSTLEKSLIDKITVEHDLSQQRYFNGFSAFLSPYNGIWQRYFDYGCFQHSQVQLASQRPINANWIHNPLVENKLFQAILTQGPLEATQCDFWNMVVQYNIGAIVAISETADIGNFNAQNMFLKKVSQYWPKTEANQNEYEIPKELFSGFGNSQDRNIQKIKSYIQQCPNSYIVKRQEKPVKQTGDIFYEVQLEVKQTQNNNQPNNGNKPNQNQNTQTKNVVHFHLDSWRDHEGLDDHQIANYVKLVKKVTEMNVKTVLHCSAGIGRSGSFLTSMFLYSYIKEYLQEYKKFKDQIDPQMEEPKLNLSLFEVVRSMRMQRNGAIQTEVQYLFLYDILTYMLSHTQEVFEIDVNFD